MAMIGRLRRRRFGEILVGDGLITHDQLDEALELQKQSGDTLGTILLDLGYIVESDIVKALSIQYQLPCLRPSNYGIDKKLFEPFDPLFLHRHLILPLDKLGNLMLVLLQDIPTKNVLEQAQEISGSDLAIYLGTSSEIRQALMEYAPISELELEAIRDARLAQKRSTVGRMGNAMTRDLEASLEDMNLSSEKLLSSLDAAWDSIFVEQGEGGRDDES